MSRLLLILFAFSFLLPVIGLSQEVQTPPMEEDQTMLYRYEAHGGFVLHSGSWGLFYRKGKHVTGYKKKFYEIEFAHMKHPKEIKLPNPQFENSKPFAFGKINALLVFRGGVGLQHALFGRNQHSGVEIRCLYAAGFSAGVIKPIYLEIFKQRNPPELNDVVVERYNPDIHPIQSILGRASFTYGLNKMSLAPGGYAKFALSFEYGRGSTDVKTIEAGVVADYYGKRIPMMEYIENKIYFLNLYVALTWGGKW
jgi:hypothetical protein